jgi:hypothetical protein
MEPKANTDKHRVKVARRIGKGAYGEVFKVLAEGADGSSCAELCVDAHCRSCVRCRHCVHLKTAQVAAGHV